MLILSDGRKEFKFYGDKEDLLKRQKKGFKVCLYEQNLEINREVDGLFIVRDNKEGSVV